MADSLTLTPAFFARPQCDAFKRAFNGLAARAVTAAAEPEYFYFSDLLYDAAECAAMEAGDSCFIMMRDGGTTRAINAHGVREALDAGEWRMVLRVTRGRYDQFRFEDMTPDFIPAP